MTTSLRGGPAEADQDELLGLYTYAVVADSPGRVPDGLAGLDGAPVRLVGQGDVAAAVGVTMLERPPGRRADLMAHHEVVEALAADGPVIPVQFGSVLPDTASVLTELVEADLDRWRGLLAALVGRQQFNLRGDYHEDVLLGEVTREDPDVASLNRRTRDLPEEAGRADRVRLGEMVARTVEAKREQDAAFVLDRVLPHVVSYAPRSGRGLERVLDTALLVDDEKREQFEDVLEALAEGMHERIRWQLVGPVPPYDFVEGDWWA